MTGSQNKGPDPPAINPVTYEELTPEFKQKYDEVKAQFEADLIGSFERTRNLKALLTMWIFLCRQRSAPEPCARR